MTLTDKPMSFKPTPQLAKRLEADVQKEQRRLGDVIRRILLRHYGLLNGGAK